MSSQTVFGSHFTARASRLPPDGVRTVRKPRVLYRSADAYPYDVDTPAGPVPAPSASPSTSDKQAQDAAASIGKALADTLAGIFGKKPPAPTTVAEKHARDVSLYIVAGAAVLGVVLVLRMR